MLAYTPRLNGESGMSTFWTSYALVGVTFTLDGFVAKSTRPSCPHSERRGQAFCPVCGKPVRDETVRDHTKYHEVRGAIEGSLGTSWHLSPTMDDMPFMVLGFGAHTEQGEHARIWPVPPMEEIRDTIRGILEPHGLWEAADPTFGLHSVTVGS